MKNNKLFLGVVFSALMIIFFSCGKKDTVSSVKQDPSFTEDFDTVANVINRGWSIKNNTKPIGTVSWENGSYYISLYHGKKGNTFYGANGVNTFTAAPPAISGTDFLMTSADCGHGKANCSNWLISPAFMIKNGDRISFYTRTLSNPADAADRLQLRINMLNSSADVGTNDESTGGFTNVLLDINSELLLEGDGSYPGEWTQYSAVVSGLPSDKARLSRVAFRYFVPDGGPGGFNGIGVGVDKFEFISVVK